MIETIGPQSPKYSLALHEVCVIPALRIQEEQMQGAEAECFSREPPLHPRLRGRPGWKQWVMASLVVLRFAGGCRLELVAGIHLQERLLLG